ncbi:MAG: calcium-binding protein [Synechococcales cyanobacterium CRU_2_2]|nr:calcium-binding protein [Synechococcales cyanobacterium CRU_2_2]
MATVNGDAIGNILVGTNLGDNLFGFSGDDILAGGLGDDALEGGSGNDVLGGGDGDDRLDGGPGFDVMVGGNGDDIYIVDNVEDVVVETDFNGGSDTIISSVDHQLGDHFEGIVLSGNGNLDASGNSLDNGLVGNSGRNQMFGLGGDDSFLASAGDDRMDGGTGIDTVDYTMMNTTITLRAAGEIHKDGLGVDRVTDVEVIAGAAGRNNQINASTSLGSPVFVNVNLSEETLRVNGIPGVEAQLLTVRNFVDVVGTSQNDLITGNALANNLSGGTGNDFIDGAGGDDILNGDAGADSLFGGQGSDILFGGLGSDLLVGGNGDDTLLGYGFIPEGEIDTLVGGSGSDIFALGDATNGRYYLAPLRAGNLDDAYAIIEDWDFQTDFIRLNGSFDYSAEFRFANGIGSSNTLDTVISSGGNILAIIQDSTAFDFNRDTIFV